MNVTFARFLAGGLLLFAIPVYGQDPAASWTVLPGAPIQVKIGRHEDVSFVSPVTGWVVNFSGEIFKTTNGGQTWARQLLAQTRTGDEVEFRSVGFANEQLGWVGSLTEGHVLYETRDGGQTWQNISNKITGADVAGLCGLWVVNEEVIYGVGRYMSPARLLKSTDGGQNWVAQDMAPLARTLIDVFFFDENHGFVVGGNHSALSRGNAVVLETVDGGDTWVTRHTSSESAEWGWKISFPTPQTGYVSVERFNGAKVLKTTDGGQTWEEIIIPGSRKLQGIGFVNEDVGWASGYGTTFKTTDGGGTWEQVTELDGRMNRFRMVNDSLGYAIGKMVYKYEGSVATGKEEPPLPELAFRLDANFPNPFAASTTIAYTLRQNAHVRLAIYDLLGRHVATLVEARQGAGVHQVAWDGVTEAGEAVPPGMYFYRLTADDHVQTRPMMRISAAGLD